MLRVKDTWAVVKIAIGDMFLSFFFLNLNISFLIETRSLGLYKLGNTVPSKFSINLVSDRHLREWHCCAFLCPGIFLGSQRRGTSSSHFLRSCGSSMRVKGRFGSRVWRGSPREGRDREADVGQWKQWGEVIQTALVPGQV